MCTPGLCGFSPSTPASSHSPHTQLIGDCKLPVGVSVSCLSLYVNPALRWRPIQGERRLSHNVTWDWLQLPCNPQRISGLDNVRRDVESKIFNL